MLVLLDKNFKATNLTGHSDVEEYLRMKEKKQNISHTKKTEKKL